ncbi:MAG: radical SAM protein [Acidobacteria bacterium]|nr:radical SAM protein [Acidobacteriota bacterium]
MQIVLADLKANDGLVSKDTVAGGYGSRMRPFSRSTSFYCGLKKKFHDHPSVQMAYLSAICASRGHEVVWTREAIPEGDVALVLSSLVDFRRETAWADAARQRGLKVGFVGLAASKFPHLFAEHADFVVSGEPETAVTQLAEGVRLSGLCPSEPVKDLDALPFPRWDLLQERRGLGDRLAFWARPLGGGFPLLSSRSCPEFCTYCPHRILASYRARSVKNVADELEQLCELAPNPYVVFRDPLFTEQRDRCLELCDEIQARGLSLRFECETRLDHLDEQLLVQMRAAGLSVVTFGVEAITDDTLRRVGRRPMPEAQRRALMNVFRKHGITSAAYYVFGFLQDSWDTIAATIDYSIELGSTFAQFKLLTPYPGTPLWKQFQPLVFETDWEKFDGYTPTFHHPSLSPGELTFLLGAAYARFYIRPSWLSNYLRIYRGPLRGWVRRLDSKTFAAHTRKEIEQMSRPVTC